MNKLFNWLIQWPFKNDDWNLPSHPTTMENMGQVDIDNQYRAMKTKFYTKIVKNMVSTVLNITIGVTLVTAAVFAAMVYGVVPTPEFANFAVEYAYQTIGVETKSAESATYILTVTGLKGFEVRPVENDSVVIVFNEDDYFFFEPYQDELKLFVSDKYRQYRECAVENSVNFIYTCRIFGKGFFEVEVIYKAVIEEPASQVERTEMSYNFAGTANCPDLNVGLGIANNFPVKTIRYECGASWLTLFFQYGDNETEYSISVNPDGTLSNGSLCIATDDDNSRCSFEWGYAIGKGTYDPSPAYKEGLTSWDCVLQGAEFEKNGYKVNGNSRSASGKTSIYGEKLPDQNGWARYQIDANIDGVDYDLVFEIQDNAATVSIRYNGSDEEVYFDKSGWDIRGESLILPLKNGDYIFLYVPFKDGYPNQFMYMTSTGLDVGCPRQP